MYSGWSCKVNCDNGYTQSGDTQCVGGVLSEAMCKGDGAEEGLSAGEWAGVGVGIGLVVLAAVVFGRSKRGGVCAVKTKSECARCHQRASRFFASGEGNGDGVGEGMGKSQGDDEEKGKGKVMEKNEEAVELVPVSKGTAKVTAVF